MMNTHAIHPAFTPVLTILGMLLALLITWLRVASAVGTSGPSAPLDVCLAGCPFVRVQAAIDAAAPSDVIRVAQGTYTETIMVNKTVTLRGGYSGPPNWERNISGYTTTLDGNGTGPVVQVTSHAPTIDGFTIIGGNSLNSLGGGVSVRDGSPTLSNNTIFNNRATGVGGGIYIENGSPRLHHNVITGNYADSSGGGIAISNSDGSPRLHHNVITNNHADYAGGGMAIWGGFRATQPRLHHNVITNNHADVYGGGVWIVGNTASPTLDSNRIISNTTGNGGGIFIDDGAKPLVINNIIARNTASSNGGGIYIDYFSQPTIINNTIVANNLGSFWANEGIFMYNTPSPIIVNNIIADHASCIEGTPLAITLNFNNYWNCTLPTTVGPHDKFVDPRFMNPENDDYRLRSVSRVINRATRHGAPATDFNGNPRPLCGGVDIGADEYPGSYPRPTLLAPGHGESVNTTRPLLDWTDSHCVTSYKVQVRQSRQTGSLVVNATTTVSQYKTPTLPGHGMTYYWRVRACNGAFCEEGTGYKSFIVTP